LPLIADPHLLTGYEHAEDAGGYQLSEDTALVQTLDFFTPTVDDPFVFGQIAAVNAINDIYAMGGKPLTAMNIVCFPIKTMDKSVLKDILSGGLVKMREAGVLLLGGHSVEDQEIKYGLSVTGVIHPQKVLYNHGARPGDHLILTKPLGTGVISTAIKAGAASQDLVQKAMDCMTQLNKKASELMLAAGDIHACTDITGFGFFGHACEMIQGENIGLLIDAQALPVIQGVRDLIESGYVPGGLYRNRNFRMSQIEKAPSCPDWIYDVCFDPQTAGGLLFSLPAAKAKALVGRMRQAGIADAGVVGSVTDAHPGKIWIE
jgi:selenide,water dikinase